jgi:hypothetical protein
MQRSHSFGENRVYMDRKQNNLPRLSSLIFAVSLVFALGCASSDPLTRTSTDASHVSDRANARAAAYGMNDVFTFGKKQNVRPPNTYKFYYKDCEAIAATRDRAHFSKTDYSCTGP